MKGAQRLFKCLVRLYPRDFRERFGDAMEADLENGWSRQRGRGEKARYLCRSISDAAISAMAERRSGTPTGEPVLPRHSSKWGLLTQDIRHAFHRLRRQPAVTAIAVVTLSLGLGIAAAVYSLVDGILLQPLPYPEPDRLVRVWSAQLEGDRKFLDATWEEVERLRKSQAFKSVAAFSIAPRDLTDDAGRPASVELARVSEGYLEVIGVSPALGRGFTPEEYQNGEPVVLLSSGFWRSRYGADPAVLGRGILIQGVDHRVVGVVPRSFDIPHGVALWRPFTREENEDDDRELVVIARLADDRNIEAVASQLETALLGLDNEDPMTAWLQPFHAVLVSHVRGPLLGILAAVVAVLLLACSNVAHLLLARVSARRRELAVRSALGANHLQLKRLLWVESLVLAVPAGIVGLGIGHLLLYLLHRLAPEDLPRLAEVQIDTRVVLVMIGVSGLAGILAGWLPARRSARTNVSDDLRANRSLGSRSRSQRALVTIEVALATLLAAAASLLFTSVEKRLDVDHGLEIQQAIQLGVSPPPHADTPALRQIFYDEVVEAVASLPGIQAAGIGNHDALDPSGFRLPFEWSDLDLGQGTSGSEFGRDTEFDRKVVIRTVDSGWMHAARLQLLAGRLFDSSLDRSAGEGTAVIDETFARIELGVERPAEALGKRFRHPSFMGEGFPTEHQIVGVVATVRADASVPPAPRLYLPHSQFPWPRMKLLVRTSREAEAQISRIRSRIWDIDPTVPLEEAHTLRSIVDRLLAHQRFQLRLMGAFSQLALLLAAIGLYAVLSGMVAERTRELGLRRALGAKPRDVTQQVLSHGLLLVLPGLALGLVSAALVCRLLAHQLFGVQGLDTRLAAIVAVTLLTVTIAAALAPLRRALQVDPMTVLREG